MSCLHLVFSASALPLVMANDDDTILLLHDAVMVATRNMSLPHSKICVRKADAEARGITEKLPATTPMIDDEQWIALTLQHDKTVSWS